MPRRWRIRATHRTALRPILIRARSHQPTPNRYSAGRRGRWQIPSDLGDRHLDMRLEAGPFAQAVVPGAQLGQRRPLDREGEPAIDLRAEHDFREAELGD